jgi:serine/threonine-protein kinase
MVQLLGGSDDVTVPNVVGQTQATADRTLRDAGLVPDFSNTSSTPQQKGQVISTDPAAGIGRKKGATVAVVVGAGPAQITLDDYKGLSYDDAAGQVRAKKLIPLRHDVDSAAPVDQVLSSSPGAGQKVTEGQKITLNVSTGRTALPNVVGQTDSEATGNLNRAGYTNITRQTVPPPDDEEAGTVFRTDPTGGTPVPKDQRITLFIAAAKPTPTPTTPSPTPPSPTASATTSPTGTPSGTTTP